MDAKDMMESMKRMEWQHAKGHLLAMLETYHPEWITVNEKVDNGFDGMHQRFHEFIKEVEDNL